ncbi:hypothetical protein A3E49_01235 [Candidatus Saccharibacteria bacterium RIFCSPHIGHO2_12_FULL_49_19]|nr:MAG: hypothetical protein A3E49_01235 [Candidatus Saccharibacteria bacterium RIFCSPHIGHO2_12_FULL_49_19]OGL38079.1 MAG: hypothetical protein A3B63_03170 [Candidatus Saccharibacteria bacterium RIFCSPLOWO2_01_FULL_49_22]
MPRLLRSDRVFRIKPLKGYSHAFHIGLTILLPLAAYVLVRIDFVSLAILLILLSKWRMFAVRPRYWVANVIAGGVDITVSVAFVLFMANTSVQWWQLFWTAAYISWTTFLKPRSDVLSVSAQAMLGQLLGLAVLYLKFGDTPLFVLVGGTWLVTYLSARHFMSSFEESRTSLYAHVWAYFSAGLAFILGHWLLFYGSIAQIIVILTVLGYSMAALYYLDSVDRLSPKLKQQLLGIMIMILVLVVALSDWTGTTV